MILLVGDLRFLCLTIQSGLACPISGRLLVRVGDLVRLTSENEIGIILTVRKPDIRFKPDEHSFSAQVIDDMFPYFVHFTACGDGDWFQKDSLEVISESR